MKCELGWGSGVDHFFHSNRKNPFVTVLMEETEMLAYQYEDALKTKLCVNAGI